MDIKIEKLMISLFQKDYQFALATVNNGIPSIRFIDAYYDGMYFYIVTYKKSRKVQAIMNNPHVSFTSRKGYGFDGIAEIIGHPLDEKNKEIREKLILCFEKWYFRHNNEQDENMCYLRIKPTNGFIYDNGIGYVVDFVNDTYKEFPFTFDTTLTEE